MIVIGKNSIYYSGIKQYLRAHDAISHLDEWKSLKGQLIILLSHPKNIDGFSDFISRVALLCANNKVVLVSTIGLNGVSKKIRDSYYYLKSKREVECEVLSQGGMVLRCGPLQTKKSNGFFTSPNLFSSISESFFEAGTIRSFGKFGHQLYGWFDRINLQLLRFSNSHSLVLLFKVAHLLKAFSKNRGYTIFSSYICNLDVSVGFGLSSLSTRARGFKFHIYPITRTESTENPHNTFSQKKHGFGNRWHGVVPKGPEMKNTIDLEIPLIKDSLIKLRLFSIFSGSYKMTVKHYTERENLCDLHGLGDDGSMDIITVRSAVINAGAKQSLEILSSSQEMVVSGLIANHLWSSVVHVGIDGLGVKSWRINGHTKRAAILTNNECSAQLLAIKRPIGVHPDRETLIIASTFSQQLKLLLKFASLQFLNWAFYSRLGIGLVDNNNCQLDIQFEDASSFSLSGKEWSYDVGSNKLCSKDIFSILEHSKNVRLTNQTRVIDQFRNGFHVYFRNLNILRSKVLELEPGRVYLGPIGNLLEYSGVIHSSFLLRHDDIFTATIQGEE